MLSGFAVESKNGPIALPASVARLVGYLALHDEPVERSLVRGELWPDADEARAGAALRTVLWRQNRMAPGLLCVNASRIGLADTIEDDLVEAKMLARHVIERKVDLKIQSDETVQGWIDTLEQELLPGWYDEWVRVPHDRWRQLRLHALEALSEQARLCGRFVIAHDAALVAVGIESLREAAHRCMIQAHLDEGNRAEAVRHYREFSSVLQAQVGVAPSMQLTELMNAARSGLAQGRGVDTIG